MNPYDFVPIDWNNPPKRHHPSLHDKFKGLSGKIEGTITAETPIFIFNSPKRVQFITNRQGQHIIPGSSLKGLFRSLVETIGNGCFLLFDGKYKREDDRGRQRRLDYRQKLPNEFKKCRTRDLCIACRMFGRIPSQGDNSNLHLGNVSFNDAVEVKICEHNAVYTIVLIEPKPRHRAFYLDSSEERIAGRKFYFHQPSGIQTQGQGSEYNQHIKPIDKGSQFAFSVQFTNLETLELQMLLYALVLEQDMRHKLGYGKPAGLGSVRFDITKLTLIDYTTRYITKQGVTTYQGPDLACYLSGSTQTLLSTGNISLSTLNELRRIWRWDPTDTTTYRYPDQDWFNDNPDEPISGTL